LASGRASYHGPIKKLDKPPATSTQPPGIKTVPNPHRMNSTMNNTVPFADYTVGMVIAPVTCTWGGNEAGLTLVKPQKVRKTKKQHRRPEPAPEPEPEPEPAPEPATEAGPEPEDDMP